jgi:uncharacterized OB-fold protein
VTLSESNSAKVRAVFEGPFRVDGGTWSRRLYGSRCSKCGTTILIARRICPHCWAAGTQQPAELSDHGTLYSYTIVRNPPAGAPGPYAIAYVDLPENIRLMVRARPETGPDTIGADVAIDIDQIGTDEDGTIVVGPVMRPPARDGGRT